jgi:hypothetical protein
LRRASRSLIFVFSALIWSSIVGVLVGIVTFSGSNTLTRDLLLNNASTGLVDYRSYSRRCPNSGRCGRACSVAYADVGKLGPPAPNGYAVDRATARQTKTGRPVRFELRDQTRQAVDEYIKAVGKKPDEPLFSGRGNSQPLPDHPAIRSLVSSWVATTRNFSVHTLFDGPKRHSSTVEPPTYVPCSCC